MIKVVVKLIKITIKSNDHPTESSLSPNDISDTNRDRVPALFRNIYSRAFKQPNQANFNYESNCFI